MAPNGNAPLSEAQQLFLERFPHLEADDPLVALQSWNALLEQKVDDFGNRLDLWTNAILTQTNLAAEQTGLITSQNLTLQQTTQSYAKFGETLTELRQGFGTLQQEFKLLKGTISAQSSALISLSDQLGLENSTQSLAEQLTSFSQKLKSLETITTLGSNVEMLTQKVNTFGQNQATLAKNMNARDEIAGQRETIIMVFLSLFLFGLIGQIWWLNSRADQINKNVNEVLIRLDEFRKP